MAVLAANPKMARGQESWRLNERGVLVAGNSNTALGHCASYLAAMRRAIAGTNPGSGLDFTLPVFRQSGERIIGRGKNLLEANGIETFTVCERFGERSRFYVASVKAGRLLCDEAGCCGDLAGVDWLKHGLIFVLPGQYPQS